MRVRHIISATLAGVLLLQCAGLAQAPLESAGQPVPREEAVRILLSKLSPGTELRIQMAASEVVGRLVEKSDDEVVLVVSGQRQVIPLADVVSIRRPMPATRIGDGKAFGIGTAVGAGVLVAVLFLGYFAR